MRRIALISEHASPLAVIGGVDSGGQNIYVANVARQLARLGHDVDVFTRRDDPRAPDSVRLDGYRVVHVRAGPCCPIPKEQLLPHMEEFGERLRRHFRRDARRGRPYDLMHANFFMSGLAGLSVKRAMGVPLVMTFHALGRVRRLHQRDADGFPDARFDIEDALVRESDRIVAECPQDCDDLAAYYGADRSRLDTVPCGFDAAEFSPADRAATRRKLGWDARAFTILQLGRLVPRKGIDNVIHGVAALAREGGRDVRLYIVGGNSEVPDERATPEIGRLRALARDAGVGDRVSFVGRRDRPVLKLYYAACDVFVTTPWYEPFGITPVEAMACARPVVGAAVGGIRSTVVDGVTGYLVPPQDPEALAACLHRLRDDERRATSMGYAGRARAARLYTWRSVARRLEAVYARALGGMRRIRRLRVPPLAERLLEPLRGTSQPGARPNIRH